MDVKTIVAAGLLSLLLALPCAAEAGSAPVLNPFSSTAPANRFSAANFTLTGTMSGTLASQTVAATLQVAPADVGTKGVIYVMAKLANLWFFKEANGAWSNWSGGAFPAAYFQGVLASSYDIQIVDKLDFSSFPDAEFYVGYGLDQADMVNNGKYQKVSSPSVSLAGTWLLSPATDPAFFGAKSLSDLANLSLVVDANGTWTYPGFCPFNGTYAVSGNQVTLTIGSSAALAYCPGGPTSGASISASYTLANDVLTLTNAAGVSAVFQKSTSPIATLVGVWFLTSSNDALTFPAGSMIALDASGEYFNIEPNCVTLGNLSVSGTSASYTVLYSVPLPPATTCGAQQQMGSVVTMQYNLTGNTLTLQQGGSSGVFQRWGF
ncbi:MAG: hypothetical protein K8F27_15420 [Sulfuricellaceae bacterium]|nr:hypothetical protein [Sulfuricellaceae bacterium]